MVLHTEDHCLVHEVLGLLAQLRGAVVQPEEDVGVHLVAPDEAVRLPGPHRHHRAQEPGEHLR